IRAKVASSRRRVRSTPPTSAPNRGWTGVTVGEPVAMAMAFSFGAILARKLGARDGERGAAIASVRPPVIQDVGRGLRWGARPERPRGEAVLLVERPGGPVLLMGVELEPARRHALGERDQARAPAGAPPGRIDVHPVDVRALHRQIGDDLLVER